MIAIAIRPMRAEDLDAVAAIEAAAHAHPRPVQVFREELALPQARLRVAVDAAGRVVGFFDYWVAADEAELIDIAVEPALQGRGLGRQLMEALLREAAAAAVVHLEVRPDNGPAVRLYEACGFRRVGRRRAYYQDGADALLYAYERGSSEAASKGSGRG